MYAICIVTPAVASCHAPEVGIMSNATSGSDTGILGIDAGLSTTDALRILGELDKWDAATSRGGTRKVYLRTHLFFTVADGGDNK